MDEKGGEPARGDEAGHGHGGAVAQHAEERAHGGARAELQGAEEAEAVPAFRPCGPRAVAITFGSTKPRLAM